MIGEATNTVSLIV